VTRLLPADKARIGSFSYRIQVDPRTFTSDRQELLRILYRELQEPARRRSGMRYPRMTR